MGLVAFQQHVTYKNRRRASSGPWVTSPWLSPWTRESDLVLPPVSHVTFLCVSFTVDGNSGCIYFTELFRRLVRGQFWALVRVSARGTRSVCPIAKRGH